MDLGGTPSQRALAVGARMVAGVVIRYRQAVYLFSGETASQPACRIAGRFSASANPITYPLLAAASFLHAILRCRASDRQDEAAGTGYRGYLSGKTKA
jgi:hypothetical protein